ncbi:hypothetical protein AZE42_12863 [Rhizopogon vesiculosus]|uniref:Uncharacterized protein n=1 Tax=Rhizopogon vesiculosus TaxID=180088 RepID=A0A1J8QID4_9AGAM|nr:hypothetical protein AZE42_12863 [Rhizopogon vesiculosus]
MQLPPTNLQIRLHEANEEVGLPLQPFPSASQLLAMHVAAFLSSLYPSPLPPSSLALDSFSNPTSNKLSSPSSNPILRSLTPSLTEVDHIFDHPLEAMPDPQFILNNRESLGVSLNITQRTFASTHLTDSSIRCTVSKRASPIKGRTADILISVAKLAYGRKHVYRWYPSNSEDDQGGAYRVLV